MPEKDKGVSRSAWARVQRAGDKYSRTSIAPHSTTPTSRLWERDKAFGSRNLEIETTNDARVGERRGVLHAPAASKPRAVLDAPRSRTTQANETSRMWPLKPPKNGKALLECVVRISLGLGGGTRVMGVG